MIEDVVLARIAQDRDVAGTAPAPLTGAGSQYEGAASFQHRLAALVYIGAERVRRAPDDGVVTTVGAPAAEVEGGEQVVVVRSLDDEHAFDGIRRLRPPCEVFPGGAGNGLTGLGIELDHFQSGPETAEGEPVL